MILLSVSIIWLAIECCLIQCKEISDTSSSLLNSELEPCYHAERLLRSGVSPDLVIRTLEATGQVAKGFLGEISTASHTPHAFRRSSQLTTGKAIPSKSGQSSGQSKQIVGFNAAVAGIPIPYPVVFPDEYTVSPGVKLTNKLKNKYRSEINTLADVVANDASLLQAYPMEITLDANKYKNSEVNTQVIDVETNIASSARSENSKDEKSQSDILNRKASTTNHEPGLCDDFVSRGIRGRNNLLNHLFTRSGTKIGYQGDDKKKKGGYVNSQGDVVIKSKAINGKNSNIRSVKDVVLGIASLDESYDILDIMDDDDFKDSKVSSKELFLQTSGTVNNN